MSQMTPADQAIVKALPGNSTCADCDIAGQPQWASVSFGTVFCLECSGVHRSLGVHISFVRSIAMDSWTPAQLKIMNDGGNKKFMDYITSKGIPASTPIKEKYESDAAQLYKEILKARAEGRPEPTELPKKVPRSGNYRPAGGMGSVSSTGGMGGGGDPNGMERLKGETDEQYIARQTRLRNEAKARMASKFGGGGMGGVGSGGGGGSSMGGIGSDPNYNPGTGYGGGAGVGDLDVSALTSGVMTGLGSAFGALSTAASSVTAAVQDENTKRQLADVSSTVMSTAGSFWGGLSSGAANLVNTVTQPDDAGSDGLADLQRQFQSRKSAQPNSKYGGFGSNSRSVMGGGGGTVAATPAMPTSASALGEAVPGPGEDPNGMAALTGESDEQYVMRQTRLRNEAKARMAAKFGGGGGSMGGVGSSAVAPLAAPGSAPSSGGFGGVGSTPSSTLREAVPGPGEDPNGVAALTGESDEQYVMRQTRLRNEAKARMAAKFGGGGGGMGGVGSSTASAAPSSGGFSGLGTSSAPSSGGFGGVNKTAPSSGNSMGGAYTAPKRPAAPTVSSGDDFFANFGT